MRDLPDEFVGYCGFFTDYPASDATSNIFWGTRYYAPGSKSSGTPNTHDWDAARERFYIAMTGKNFAGESQCRFLKEKFLRPIKNNASKIQTGQCNVLCQAAILNPGSLSKFA